MVSSIPPLAKKYFRQEKKKYFPPTLTLTLNPRGGETVKCSRSLATDASMLSIKVKNIQGIMIFLQRDDEVKRQRGDLPKQPGYGQIPDESRREQI